MFLGCWCICVAFSWRREMFCSLSFCLQPREIQAPRSASTTQTKRKLFKSLLFHVPFPLSLSLIQSFSFRPTSVSFQLCPTKQLRLQVLIGLSFMQPFAKQLHTSTYLPAMLLFILSFVLFFLLLLQSIRNMN